MKDTRLQQALAALDDARTSLQDILQETAPGSVEGTLLTCAFDETNRAIKGVQLVVAC